MVSKDVDPMRNILIKLYRRMLKLKLKKGGNASSSWLHRNRSDSAAPVFGYNRFMEVNLKFPSRRYCPDEMLNALTWVWLQ